MIGARGEDRARAVTIAWGIHGLSATGIILGAAAINAVVGGHPRAALLWLAAALVVDAIDGPLARQFRVNEVVPHVDGNTLDLMVDYVTCIFVPIAFIFEFGMLPDRLELVLSALALVTSLIWMARRDMETDDHFFNGFPGMWVLVAQGLYLLETPTWFNAVCVVVFSVLGLTSVKFVHPVQVVHRRRITLPLTIGWIGLQLGLVITGPSTPLWAKVLLLMPPAWFCVVGIERGRAERRGVIARTTALRETTKHEVVSNHGYHG